MVKIMNKTVKASEIKPFHCVKCTYNIIDKELSDVSFFNTSRKKTIIKRIFGKKYLILFYGGAFFALGKSRFL